MEFLEKLLETNEEKSDKRGAKGRKARPAPKRKPPAPPRRNWFQSCLLLVILLVGGMAAVIFLGLRSFSTNQALQAEAAVTDVTLTAYDGQSFQVSDFQGRLVVLNFWSAGCIPCQAEAYSLQAIQDSYQDKGVTVIGLNPLDSDPDARAFLSQFQLTFLNAPDTAKIISQRFNVASIPTTLILNRDGSVAESLTFPVDYQRLKTLLDTLLTNG